MFRTFFRNLSLSAKLISSYLVFLGIGGLAITVVGSTIVSSTIMAEAERTVSHDLAIARAMYRQDVRLLDRTVRVAAAGSELSDLLARNDTAAVRAYLADIRSQGRMDFLAVTGPDGRVRVRAAPDGARLDDAARLPVVGQALDTGRPQAGTMVMSAAELEREDPALRARARVPLMPTARAEPSRRREITSGLVLAAAAPVKDADGNVIGTVYAGHLLNGDFDIVDAVWDELYEGDARDSVEVGGTVTLFLGDVRLSTNVRTPTGERATGTRVSAPVAEAVLKRGERWNGRAFVVDDWFITAYEPLRDVTGRIVGMLYVGLPEASYVATRDRVILSFIGIASVGFLLVLAVTYIGIQRMTRPLGQMAAATRSIAAGDFDHEVEVDPRSESEIARLAGSFNLMLQGLRQMRGDLEEWALTLEEKVRERTDELVKMQARVAQSERLASLGMLAAGVAHEVNNPLGGILALTSLTLEEIPEDHPERENLEEVVRQTERCRDIVKHLLEFSRQTEVSPEELNLNEILERTLALLRRQSLFFNIQVDTHLAPDLPPIFGDSSQLEQVFMNILMNAVQAMDEQGTITITTRRAPGDDSFIELLFADTGKGIPEEHVGRIFDPFFSTGKEGQGTGLGLSIAYGIISKHQGTITVESRVAEGTTFTIRLPVAARFAGTAEEELETPVVAWLGGGDA